MSAGILHIARRSALSGRRRNAIGTRRHRRPFQTYCENGNASRIRLPERARAPSIRCAAGLPGIAGRMTDPLHRAGRRLRNRPVPSRDSVNPSVGEHNHVTVVQVRRAYVERFLHDAQNGIRHRELLDAGSASNKRDIVPRARIVEPENVHVSKIPTNIETKRYGFSTVRGNARLNSCRINPGSRRRRAIPRIVNLMNAVKTAASTPLPLTSAMRINPRRSESRCTSNTSPPTAKWLLAAPYALPISQFGSGTCSLRNARCSVWGRQSLFFERSVRGISPAVEQYREQAKNNQCDDSEVQQLIDPVLRCRDDLSVLLVQMISMYAAASACDSI